MGPHWRRRGDMSRGIWLSGDRLYYATERGDNSTPSVSDAAASRSIMEVPWRIYLVVDGRSGFWENRSAGSSSSSSGGGGGSGGTGRRCRRSQSGRMRLRRYMRVAQHTGRCVGYVEWTSTNSPGRLHDDVLGGPFVCSRRKDLGQISTRLRMRYTRPGGVVERAAWPADIRRLSPGYTVLQLPVDGVESMRPRAPTLRLTHAHTHTRMHTQSRAERSRSRIQYFSCHLPPN